MKTIAITLAVISLAATLFGNAASASVEKASNSRSAQIERVLADAGK